MTLIEEFDCKNSTYRYISGKAYAGTRFEGAPVADKFASMKDSKPTPIAGSGFEQSIFPKVCN